MSGQGQPSDKLDAECVAALERLVFFVDHELPSADEAAIQQHIDECAPCLRAYDVERIVKTLVARSCCDQAPVELRRRVLVTIRQVQVTYDQG